MYVIWHVNVTVITLALTIRMYRYNNLHTPWFVGLVAAVPVTVLHVPEAPSENSVSTGMGSVPTVPSASQSYT